MSSYYGVNHILLRNSVRCLFSNQRNGWPMGGRGARRTRRNLRQMACKPGSVHRPRGQLDGHSSGTFVAERLARPTRTAARKCASPAVKPARRPYLVLLPVGFAMPLPLPVARCALTAPFHPYRPAGFPAKAGGLLSVALSLGSPPPDVIRHRISVEPGLSSPRETSGSGHPAIWRSCKLGSCGARCKPVAAKSFARGER